MIAQNNQQLIQQTGQKFANIPQKLDQIFSNYQIRQRFLLNTQPRISQSLIFGSVFSLSLLSSIFQPVKAQITADDSVDTEVKNSGDVAEITGGTIRGSNLFHSFQNFSVASGSTALFNNASNIANIISRVTGSSISNIDGLIQANGNANLILINPNGINFGANAQLDIGGSFLASSADTIVFEDGTLYSAADTDTTPLLTVSVPVGLQLGQNSGAINVQGTGHNLSLATPVFSPLTRGDVGGLEVNSGETLALVGNGLGLTGGTLTAESGSIELASVAEGTVRLDFSSNWNFDYGDVEAFNNINLAQQALADVSGDGNGAINLQGREIALKDGSVVLMQNLGNLETGKININATESLNLVGAEPEGVIASGIFTEALGDAKGGDIDITTSQLVIDDGGNIISTTAGNAAGGNVNIQASEFMRFSGFSTINPNKFSVVSVQTFGAGDAGNVNVLTKKFTALEGANISSITGGTGTGSGGDIQVDATEAVELIGVNPIAFAPSQITAGSGSRGNAGNVSIDTSKLIVQDGARVDASATAIGNAGKVTINASEFIEVSGTFPGSINPSLITASANILDPSLREFFGLPDVPSGNSGSIAINTP
ncbi:MAG: filamentous hemagglutinin N-terminal domain-containing protein, partial [Waterburya sp.]